MKTTATGVKVYAGTKAELATELGIAALRRGREVRCKTRGKRGVVILMPVKDGAGEWASFEVFVRGEQRPMLPIGVHAVPWDAVEQFLALTGEKAGFGAICAACVAGNRADGTWDAHDVEAVVAERSTHSTRTRLAMSQGRKSLGIDRLSFSMCFSGRGKKWGFINRLCIDEDGSTTTGASNEGFAGTVEETVERFAGRR